MKEATRFMSEETKLAKIFRLLKIVGFTVSVDDRSDNSDPNRQVLAKIRRKSNKHPIAFGFGPDLERALMTALKRAAATGLGSFEKPPEIILGDKRSQEIEIQMPITSQATPPPLPTQYPTPPTTRAQAYQAMAAQRGHSTLHHAGIPRSAEDAAIKYKLDTKTNSLQPFVDTGRMEHEMDPHLDHAAPSWSLGLGIVLARNNPDWMRRIGLGDGEEDMPIHC